MVYVVSKPRTAYTHSTAGAMPPTQGFLSNVPDFNVVLYFKDLYFEDLVSLYFPPSVSPTDYLPSR